MKKIIVSLTLAVAVMIVPFASFAANSPTPSGNRSAIVTTTSASSVTATPTPGTFTKQADGSYVFVQPDGTLLKSGWAVVSVNGDKAWRYFGADGVMMTGWVWIRGTDGKARCYFLGRDGACVLGGKTADGYTVNTNGEWVVNGVVQTK